VGIGDTLAEARQQAGLSVTQVSQQTRIRESIIRSVELGDFSPCGGDFYARGHIRSIAEVVGVDPAPLIRDYDQEHGRPGGMRAAQIFEPATPIKIREPRRLHLGKVLGVALLAAIGYGAYHFVSTNGSHPAATATAKVRPAVGPSPKVTVTPAAHKTTPPIPKGTAIIRLNAVSDCWVGLTTADGKSIFQGLVPAGHTMTWTEKQKLSMVIGNPPGVKLTVNGKPETMNTIQVVTLAINPKAKTPVSASQ
jgi:cytoskeletal protein RodZ